MSFTITKPAISTGKNHKHNVHASPPKQISTVILHTYILFILELF